MQKEVYDRLFKKSWADLKNNPVLFVPFLLMLLASLVLVFLFFSVTGVFSYVQQLPIYFRENPFSAVLNNNIPQFIMFFIIYVVLELLVSAYFTGMKYAMAKDVVEKGKTSLASGCRQANAFFLKVVGLEILIPAILAGPLLIFFVFQQLSRHSTNITGNFFSVMFLLLFAVYFVYMLFHLVFLYPVLFVEKKRIRLSFKKEFHYVKTHFVHTLISWLLIIGVMLLLFVATLPFDRIAHYSDNLLVLIVVFLVLYVLEIIFANWEHLFVIRAYREGKKHAGSAQDNERQSL